MTMIEKREFTLNKMREVELMCMYGLTKAIHKIASGEEDMRQFGDLKKKRTAYDLRGVVKARRKWKESRER